MFKLIDRLLDKLTMYRLLLYYLIALLAVAVGLSMLGRIHYGAAAIAFSGVYLTVVCWVSNKVFANVFDAPSNIESSLITALILALIITPPTTAYGVLFLTAAGGLAMASKYMLAIGRKHIFNPAAIAVVLTAWGAGQAASWWVGTASMLPFVAIGGILLIQKIHRWKMVLTFLAVALASTMLMAAMHGQDIFTTLHRVLLTSSLFFLAFVMLTEPLTSPSVSDKQVWYAALVGALFSPLLHVGSVYSTPEITLVVGNVFSYIVNPKVKLFPVLTNRVKVAANTADFIFAPDRKFAYLPGQYMEWTIPHTNADSRGNRRYFTLASSPTEKDVRIGVKFYHNGSSYKKAMLAMDGHSQVVAADLGGDFTLPKDHTQKLAFIAGGIGVTPYRSMIKYLTDTNSAQPVTMIYSANDINDFAYTDIFDEAERRVGIKTTYTITGPDVPHNWHGETGLVTAEMIQRAIPDYRERTFYISGSQPMVAAMENTLHSIGVRHIKTDFFPGYA
jgi:glycine betaine catabolism B